MIIKDIQQANCLLLTDGGLETTLIYQHDITLAHFAAFEVLDHPAHRKVLDTYYREYLDVAARYRMGFILESCTWRASSDWGFRLGYSKSELIRLNLKSIEHLKELRQDYREKISPLLVSGCLGPRGDGYRPGDKMSSTDAAAYHALQIEAFKTAGVDLVTALTLSYTDEALGIVQAAAQRNLPVVISFTVETDGHLPDGTSLGEAINTIDKETDNYPAYYMINCAHPTHFLDKIEGSDNWKHRLGGIRANASCRSHAELDVMETLDRGDEQKLATGYGHLLRILPNLKVIGGCCGTDIVHLNEICNYLLQPLVEVID